MIDIVEFQEEAEKLARSGQKYQDSGNGEPTAYWHESEEGPGLCLSILLDAQWLNVYLDEDSGGHVEFSSTPITSPYPLFSSPYSSLPPVDGVFNLGSEKVGAFLEQHDWPRNEPFNDNFPAPAPSEYEKIWQNNCPLYQQDIDVVTGGWHFPWPDGDWGDFIHSELVLWTLRDAEPWIEVFKKGDEYIVLQRGS